MSETSTILISIASQQPPWGKRKRRTSSFSSSTRLNVSHRDKSVSTDKAEIKEGERNFPMGGNSKSSLRIGQMSYTACVYFCSGQTDKTDRTVVPLTRSTWSQYRVKSPSIGQICCLSLEVKMPFMFPMIQSWMVDQSTDDCPRMYVCMYVHTCFFAGGWVHFPVAIFGSLHIVLRSTDQWVFVKFTIWILGHDTYTK
ncbi:hypothetical protein B0H66DRAFT_544084 [Apodospora peruviana]|uniref:Uncharacterized protein n=1 Tax=Apodospora peruviana TaxID=516989 RepID=A0AAE0IT73_9PEZI|nr:hypothetical protein B0H66DRAFT_544084 [Apodospora peruviana]